MRRKKEGHRPRSCLCSHLLPYTLFNLPFRSNALRVSTVDGCSCLNELWVWIVELHEQSSWAVNQEAPLILSHLSRKRNEGSRVLPKGLALSAVRLLLPCMCLELRPTVLCSKCSPIIGGSLKFRQRRAGTCLSLTESKFSFWVLLGLQRTALKNSKFRINQARRSTCLGNPLLRSRKVLPQWWRLGRGWLVKVNFNESCFFLCTYLKKMFCLLLSIQFPWSRGNQTCVEMRIFDF